MTNISKLTDELLNLNVKEAIELKMSIEKAIGVQVLPTLDIRIVPGVSAACRGAKNEQVITIIKAVGPNPNMFKDIAINSYGEKPAHIAKIIEDGNGIFENKKDKEEADALKPALEAVSVEVELK